MGIQDILPEVLNCAGHKVDLRDFAAGIVDRNHRERSANGKRRRIRRPLRIGVDVSSWICRATYGFGDMLGDERHLTNYGRASLIDERNLKEQRQQQVTAPSDKATTPSEAEDDSSTKDAEETLPENVRDYILKCVDYVMKRVMNLQTESKAELLIVLDGETPPIKERTVQKRREIRQEQERNRDAPVTTDGVNTEADLHRRTKGNRRAGAGKYYRIIVNEIIHELRLLEISFMFAPYEADSQLAFLSKSSLIDLVVTEDSDLIAHGANSIMYKSMNDGGASGIVVQMTDIGAVNPVMSSKKLDFTDFSPVMLATLFVAAGCDYCTKLSGIGIKTATNAVRKAFLEKREEHSGSALSIMFSELYAHSYDGEMTDESKKQYEENFMSALLMYRHPVVYDPRIQECVFMGDPLNFTEDGGGDMELIEYTPYSQLCEDENRIAEVVGNLGDESIGLKVEGLVGRERHPAFQKSPLQEHFNPKLPQIEFTGAPEIGSISDDEDEDMPATQDLELHVPVQSDTANERGRHGGQQEDEDMFDTHEAGQSVSRQSGAQTGPEEGNHGDGQPLRNSIGGDCKREPNESFATQLETPAVANERSGIEDIVDLSQDDDDDENTGIPPPVKASPTHSSQARFETTQSGNRSSGRTSNDAIEIL